MRPIRFAMMAGVLSTLLCAGAAWSAKPEPKRDPDEAVLRRAGVATDNASLLEFLRSRSWQAPEKGQIERLVRQLNGERFREREEATRRLKDIGLPALSALQRAKTSEEAEVVRRAKDCLEHIYRNKRVSLPLFATRLLVKRRVEGAVEALLRYLPYESDEATQEEIWYGLDALGIREGNVARELVTALRDVRPERRAVAACIVGRAGDERQRAMVRELLKDANQWVRLRAAQGLLAGKDKSSIAALIALLDEKVPLTLAWQAEELLVWAAGKEAPKMRLGDGAASSRQKCRVSWGAWWRQKGVNRDLAREVRFHAPPRLLLLSGGVEGKCIRLCGSDGGERWIVQERNTVLDAQLTASGHLLIVEVRGDHDGVVLERDLAGNILRQFSMKEPRTCKRLPNGNLFVVEGWGGNRAASERTAEGEVLYKWTLPARQGFCKAIRIMDNGNLLWASRENDEMWKEQVEWSVGETDPITKDQIRLVSLKDRMDSAYVLPEGEGTMLILERGFQAIELYETEEGVILPRKAGPYQPARLKGVSEGKTVWQQGLLGIDATDVLRLRGGDTSLIVGWMDGMPGVVERTAEGKRVWEVIFNDRESGVRIHSCLGLVSFGFPWRLDAASDVDSVAVRIEQLKHGDPHIRKMAVGALIRHGPKAEAAVPLLVETLDDPILRHSARRALEAIGKKGTSCVARAMKDKRLNVRLGAVNTLATISEMSRSVVPLYAEALGDESEQVRQSAARELGEFGKKGVAAVPALTKALKDKNLDVTITAASSLGKIGHADKDVVSALLEATRSKNDSLRFEAIVALGRTGTGASSVVPRLVAALNEPEFKRSSPYIVEAWGDIGPDAKLALPILIQLVAKRHQESDQLIVRFAIEALGKIGPQTKEVVPTLIDCLQDNKLRRVAAAALRRIGPHAKAAIPALTEAQKNSDSRFAQEATKALRAIRGE